MKRFVFALAGLLLAAASGARAEQSTYSEVPFKSLSEQKLSAQAEMALKVEPENWRHAESANFIYHYTDARQAETVLAHAESYYAWVQQMFGVEVPASSRKAQVFIFNDEKLWDEFRYRGTMERIPGAEAFTDGHELYIHRLGFWLEPQRVLAHELAHVVLFRILGDRLPLYLNEGYAEYLGYKAIALKFGGDEYSMRSIRRLSAGEYIPLEKLAAVRVYPKDKEEMQSLYLECQLFVRFLLERYGNLKFFDFLKSSLESKSLAYSLHHVYGADVQDVERDFRVYATDSTEKTPD